MTRYLYVLATLALTVYGQLVLKAQVNDAGPVPAAISGKLSFVTSLLTSPWIVSVLVAAVLASASWMMAMTHFPLSHAYPFMSLSFPLVLLGSAVWLNELVTVPTVAGVAIIAVGLVVANR